MATPDEIEAFKVACRADFSTWFQGAAHIQPKDPTAGLEIPTANVMQRAITEAIEWCEKHREPCRIVNLKPRQGGSSSFFVGKAYHKWRSDVCNVAILGDDLNTTEKLMRMWKRYGENDAMRAHWGNKERTESWLEATNGSTLTLESANDVRAGQGGTFQVLVASEVASYRSSGHATGEDVFSSIAGCVPRLAGTLIVLESTAGGMVGIFYTTYQGAVTFEEWKAGKRGNGYIKFFTPWFAFPDYQYDGRDGRPSITAHERAYIVDTLDEREADLITRFGAETITVERLAWRRATIAGPDCGGDPDKFDREYPSDDVTAFRSTGSAFFDHPGLTWQESAIIPMQPQLKHFNIQIRNRAAFPVGAPMQQGVFRVWDGPQEGCSYLIGADFCVGKQAAGSRGERDANAVGVWRAESMDPRTGQVRPCKMVAAVKPEDRSETKVICARIAALHHWYGHCVVVPEINNKDNICEQLRAAGVENIWSQQAGADGVSPAGRGKTVDVEGFFTSGTRIGNDLGGVRKQILDNMATAVREQAFICSCPVLLRQMKMFIRNARGKPEAAPGEHDDWVMMAAISLFCMPSATPYVPPGLRAQNQADQALMQQVEMIC